MIPPHPFIVPNLIPNLTHTPRPVALSHNNISRLYRTDYITMRQSSPIYLQPTTLSKDKIKEKLVYTSNAVYRILNYDTVGLSYNDTSHRLYRSVILSYPENEIVCFSPPKTHDVSEFMKTHSLALDTLALDTLALHAEDIHVNELVEGVMINVFYDTRIALWEISTKSAVSGKYSYAAKRSRALPLQENPPTFLQLFLDALRVPDADSLDEVALFRELPKEMCYSFVLQHPKNKICSSVSEPAVYLVAVYRITNPTLTETEPSYVQLIHPRVYQNWHVFQTSTNPIRFPNEVDTTQTLHEIVCREISIHRTTDSRGIMITDVTSGNMYAIQNVEYMKAFRYRNARDDLFFYKYICFLRLGKVSDYLAYYPVDKKAFLRFSARWNEFVENIYTSYVTKYVFKRPMAIHERYNRHIYKLHHDVYLPSLRCDNKTQKITRAVIRDYMLGYEPRVVLEAMTP